MTTNTLRKVTLVTIVPDCKCGFIEAVADEQSFWSHEWACPYVAGFDDEDEYDCDDDEEQNRWVEKVYQAGRDYAQFLIELENAEPF